MGDEWVRSKENCVPFVNDLFVFHCIVQLTFGCGFSMKIRSHEFSQIQVILQE